MAEKKENKVVQGIIGLVFIVLMAFFVPKLWDNSDGKNSNSIDKSLKQAVDKINEQAPFMIDANTRFDEMTIVSSRTLQYNFTAVNLTKDDVDVEEFEDYLVTMAANQMRTNPRAERFRKLKVTVIYSYVDMNGDFICDVTITPDMYQ